MYRKTIIYALMGLAFFLAVGFGGFLSSQTRMQVAPFSSIDGEKPLTLKGAERIFDVEIETFIEVENTDGGQCLLLSNPAIPCGNETIVIDVPGGDAPEVIYFEGE